MVLKLANLTELNGFGWTHLCASRHEVVLLAVVTKCALVRSSVSLIAIQHTERTRGDTVCATIANILLHINVPELVVDESASRAHLFTRCELAVLAHIA